MTDRWLGVLLARLARARPRAGNTVIALVGDHGHLLGEYGWTGKIASMLHPPLIHVPLMIVDPRAGRRGTSGYLAQTHDVGPTLLVAGRACDAPEGMDGVDLSPLLRGQQPRERRSSPTAATPTGTTPAPHDWAYVPNNFGSGRRLYDLERDAREEQRHRAPPSASGSTRSTAAIRRRAGKRFPVYH